MWGRIQKLDVSRRTRLFDLARASSISLAMNARRRLLIAIEKAELRFWKLATRLLHELRERSFLAGARGNDDIEAALVWAVDAERARREEVAHLSGRTAAPAEKSRSVRHQSGIRWAA